MGGGDLVKIKELQEKQAALDAFIVEHNKLEISDSEMLKNMILACHDEISEVEEAPDDITEYIDVLHFVLSIANRCNLVLDEERIVSKIFSPKVMRNELLDFTRESRMFKHWRDRKSVV